MSVNKVILLGRLGQDPSVRYMTNGDAVTNVSMATSESWKDKSGAKQEKTDWHNLIFFRRLAEIAKEYLVKGSHVYIEGKLQTRKWQDKEGKDRYTTEIVVDKLDLLGGKPEGAATHAVRPAPQKVAIPNPEKPVARNTSFDNFDDDLPF